MKQRLFSSFATLFSLLVISSSAAPMLVWDPSPESDVAGYFVNYTNATTSTNGRWNAGAQNAYPLSLQPGHSYAFTVTAYNFDSVESAPSAPLLYDAPVPPSLLVVTWDRSIYSAVANYTVHYAPLNQTAQTLQAGLSTTASLSNLVRGATYYFYVTARDAIGSEIDRWVQVTRALPAEGDLGTLHIPRANQAPQVALTSPAPLSTHLLPTTVSLAATASDPDGTVASVEFYVGSTLISTRTAAPYSASWTPSNAGTYQLSAVARDNQGASTRSSYVQVSVQTPPPAAPSGLAGTASEYSVRLTWVDTSSNESGFRIYRGNGSSFTQIATLAANSREYLDSGLTPETTYYYRVGAYNSAGETSSSTVPVTTAMVLLPPPPGSINAASVSGGLQITWSLSEGATGYDLQRSLAAAGPFTTIRTTTSSSYLDSAVVAGTVYYYRVMARKDTYVSAPSPLASAAAPGSAPAAPSNLRASVVSKIRVNLTWRDNASNEAGYIVERSLDGVAFTTIASLPANSVAFADGALAPRRRYYYRVKAQNSVGATSSTVVSIKTR